MDRVVKTVAMFGDIKRSKGHLISWDDFDRILGYKIDEKGKRKQIKAWKYIMMQSKVHMRWGSYETHTVNSCHIFLGA